MLLVGGAASARLLAPGLVSARAPAGLLIVRTGLVVGALLLMAGALLEVAVTLRGVLGRVDPALFQRYLSSTSHGRLTIVRLVVAPLLAGVALVLTQPRFRAPARAGGTGTVGLGAPDAGAVERGASGSSAAPAASGPGSARAGRWLGDLVLVVFAGELLYSFSQLSHAAAMGGAAPLWADFVHLAAAALWAGPLLYLAFIGGFGAARPQASAALRRLSVAGLLAVVALALTGAFNALTHAGDPGLFATSAYGWSLWVKLALFALVLGLAARNRFVLLPRYLAGGAAGPLLGSVRLEALVLVAIFVATGALTTAALPHAHGVSTDAFVNLQRILGLQGR